MQDLWARYQGVMKARGGSMNVPWTKRHTTTAQSRSMSLSDAEVHLNGAAHRFADEAAARAQVSDQDVAATSQADLLAAEGLKRLLAIRREVRSSSRRGLRVPGAPRRERGEST
eukprot:9414684-Pyramimonas_sp.AAC.1